MHIVDTLKPRWLVLENVTGLLNSNDGKDFQEVVKSLAQCGYVGFWRVLNAAYFGVPTARRRVFLVAGLGAFPPIGFMADAGAVGELPQSAEADGSRPHNTLLRGVASASVELEERMRDYWLARHKEEAADAPSAQECEECGEIIPEARRLAVPGCRLCIECRREEEQRQKFKR